MSTGPGPTRKADGTADASVDDIADLLVEDDPSVTPAPSEEASEDGLDIMLETPGPALANPFMPPPPSPMGDVVEENESADEDGAATNLAYEDLLAKLVLPAKALEPEPEMPALMSSVPLPEPVAAPLLPLPVSYPVPSGQSLEIAPPAEERTLVTENPLVAEEQEAAVREGRMGFRDQPVAVQEDMRSVPTEPVVVAANGVAAKSRLVYLMLGGLLVLGGMILAVLVLKLLMPTPAPSPPAIVAPTPPPPPPSARPAHVEPLPPSAAPAAVAPIEPPPAASPENAAGIPETVPTVEPGRPAPRPHRPAAHPKPARPAPPKAAAAPKPTPAPKQATASKVAPAPAPKAPKAAPAKKASKTGGYADPFDN
ncbi:MAG TPA: hypothetical protein VF524_08825 [Polyangia bacterium]